MQLQLYALYVLPNHATAEIKLFETQIASLSVCLNYVFSRIIHFNRWESVKCFMVV